MGLLKNRHLRVPIPTPAFLSPFDTRPDRIRCGWWWRCDPVEALLGALLWGDLGSFARRGCAPFVLAVWSLALPGRSLARRATRTHTVRQHSFARSPRRFVPWLGVLPAPEHLRVAVFQPDCAAATELRHHRQQRHQPLVHCTTTAAGTTASRCRQLVAPPRRSRRSVCHARRHCTGAPRAARRASAAGLRQPRDSPRCDSISVPPSAPASGAANCRRRYDLPSLTRRRVRGQTYVYGAAASVVSPHADPAGRQGAGGRRPLAALIVYHGRRAIRCWHCCGSAASLASRGHRGASTSS